MPIFHPLLLLSRTNSLLISKQHSHPPPLHPLRLIPNPLEPSQRLPKPHSFLLRHRLEHAAAHGRRQKGLGGGTGVGAHEVDGEDGADFVAGEDAEGRRRSADGDAEAVGVGVIRENHVGIRGI